MNATHEATHATTDAAALAYFIKRLEEKRASAEATVRKAAQAIATAQADDLVHQVELAQAAIDAAGMLRACKAITHGDATSLVSLEQRLMALMLGAPVNPHRSTRGTTNLIDIAYVEAMRDLYSLARSLASFA